MTLPPDVVRSLALLALGLYTDEVAAELGLDPGIVRRHVALAMTTLGTTSKLETVVRAHELALFTLPCRTTIDAIRARHAISDPASLNESGDRG